MWRPPGLNSRSSAHTFGYRDDNQFYSHLHYVKIFILVLACVFPEIHRELLHRPVSGYVPEEIWKKAGELLF